VEEKIQAHVLSIWREGRGFFSGKGREGMLILTNKNLCFIKKTEAPMKWWGAIRTRQIVRLLQSKDVMMVEDGYGEENLREDLENKKTIVFVTHNVAEAVMLGTRVLVFTHRPARIKKEFKIDYKRPRTSEDENLLPYQQKILAELRPEVKK